MSTPITTSSAQSDVDSSAQRDAETKPEIAEKTALMEVYTASEGATGGTGAGGTRTAYLPLGQASPPRILRIGTPALLLVVPLTYIGRKQSSNAFSKQHH